MPHKLKSKSTGNKSQRHQHGVQAEKTNELSRRLREAKKKNSHLTKYQVKKQQKQSR